MPKLVTEVTEGCLPNKMLLEGDEFLELQIGETKGKECKAATTSKYPKIMGKSRLLTYVYD